MNLQLPSPKPPWQAERAIILNRICNRILARNLRGQSLKKAISVFSRRWHGKPFCCDPKRKLQLKSSTLFQLYRRWRLHGQTPDVFELGYMPKNRRVTAQVLIRFVNFAAIREFRSCKAAWQAFCLRRGNAGPGEVRLGYDALLWNLPGGFWRNIKAAHATRRQAEQAIHSQRLSAILEIQARVSAKVRPRKPANFQI